VSAASTGPGDVGAVPEALQRLLTTRRRPDEACEMCAAALEGPRGHAHVVDVGSRSLKCVCRPCALLFTSDGAAGGRFRAVPERYRHDPGFVLPAAQWDALQIPVGLAFFFVNSALGTPVAMYPSPAGATESQLPLDAWTELTEANPALTGLEPDVEALLVRRLDHPSAGGGTRQGTDDGDAARSTGFACYLVPIDACYELVGLVRTHWRGFDGGTEARQAIAGFFDRVDGRCRPVRQGR